ncbi:hypothetical protein AYO22_06259 [Fonsecaea multimorphosa]|nr:hypothetical protein AYO22_06259 [Fonsecaea multimorphosa]
MSIPDVLPLSPPSTSSRRKVFFPNASANPTRTPDLPSSFPGSSNTATRKRVGFSVGTHSRQPSSASQPSSSTTRPLPSSSGSQSALKSILKPCLVDEHTAQAVDGAQDAKRTMGELMESIVQQLSRDDRSVSVDAYQTLSSVIREYDDIPEEDVLKAKLTIIMRYIKRDLQKQPNPDEPPIADTNLVTQALKVLVIFVWNRDYSSLLTDEYRIFVLDRSIQVISEHAAPKGVIIHYLHLLATQNFRPVLVNNNRVTRLLEALKALTEHVKGNGVVSERLLVYQKLLDQARPTMKARANLWVEELLTGMTNSLKDVRTKAIATGLKACSIFSSSSSISATLKTVLGEELTPGKTFSSAMCRRLEKMITVKEEGIQVPQIWTIILMLSNGVEDRDPNGPWPRFDKWPQFMDWLKVIQTCFNCSDSAIKQQAYMAWDRFIHIIQPHQTSDTLMALLAKPLTAQMERQSIEQTSKGTRPTAVSSYCTLLYYAFRPAATHKQYTRVWNEYIVKVMKSSFFEKSSANADIASRIFTALFWNSKKSTKVWNEKRALENTRVEPEELPTIDCKWIRAKSKAILDMFQVLMRYSSWGASGQSDRAFIAVAWSHFLKALREASSKEIKPSPETVDAMTNVANYLGSLFLFKDCSELASAVQADDILGLSIAQVRHLTLAAVTELGNDLIKIGLETNCDIKTILVIFDTLDSVMLELKNEEDCRPCAPPEEPKSETRSLSSQCQELLGFLNARLLRCFRPEQSAGNMWSIMLEIRQLEGSLEGIPREYVVCLTRLLLPTLSVLLQHQKAENETSPDGCYSKIIVSSLHIISRYPFGTIEDFDDVFAALFESSQLSVRDEAVTMWNMRFGHLHSVTMGPRLSEALLKLRNAGIDVHIPCDLMPPGQLISHEATRPSAAEEATTPISNRPSSSPAKDVRGAGLSPELGSQYYNAGAARRPDPVFSSPEKRSLRPRARHDDSQVQFVPIGHDQQELEIPASPTPRARHVAHQIADIDVPSSPPSIPGNRDRGEVTSSPPQPIAEDGQVRIDLAIAPPQAAYQQIAVKASDLPPAEVATGHVSPVVKQKPMNTERDVHMQDQSADDAMRLHSSTAKAPAETACAEDDGAGSSPMATPRSDSDEIDMLSASQLSHDLDQHLSQVVEDEALPTPVKTSGISFEEEGHNNQPKPQARRGRKRKSNSLRFTSTKRRKSQSTSQTSSQSIAMNSFLDNTTAEIQDCIEIAPSRAVQAIAAEELAHPTQAAGIETTSAPKRRRGRQRRRQDNASPAAHSPIDHNDTIEVIVPGPLRSREGAARESVGLETALSIDGDAAAEDHQLNSGADEGAVSTGVLADSHESAEGGGRPSISAMLQGVLDRLKSTAPGDVDLRALDDLCFQIRFQAQVIAQGQGAQQ